MHDNFTFHYYHGFMKKKLKQPSDYQQFSFRIGEDDKKKLNKKLNYVLALLKEKKHPDEYEPTKNKLILRALNRGLSQILHDLERDT